MGELTKISNTGKCSPGPIYNYQESIKYKEVMIYNGFGLNKRYIYSCRIGVLELLNEQAKTNLNMIFMKTISLVMIH